MKHKKAPDQYQDKIVRIFPEERPLNLDKKSKYMPRPLTFQVTDDCNLNCSYCYQINKGHRVMSFETAKKIIDRVLSGEGMNDYLTINSAPGIMLEFIGGEPFLQVELIDKIVDYFRTQTILLKHPWANRYMISICSNGVLHNTPKVQMFLEKNKYHLSYSITIDGDKELHDSCRVFHDGSPSYDIAIAGAKDWMDKGNFMGSKITIAPGNITHLFKAIIHMIDLGYTEINANCVYEEGWEPHHARELYYQMKNISDYLLSENLDDDVYISLFSDIFFCPKDPEDTDTWCGGLGSMLACDPDGYLYPCIRYMESSLGNDVPPIRIGHVDTGICQTEEERNRLECLKCVDRRTYNTDECFYCPIAAGCSDCAAYNYQVNGTPNQRAIFICIMHKARALANAYFWAKYYEKHGDTTKFKMYMSREKSLEIIPEEEFEMLKNLPNIEYMNTSWEQVKASFDERKI